MQHTILEGGSNNSCGSDQCVQNVKRSMLMQVSAQSVDFAPLFSKWGTYACLRGGCKQESLVGTLACAQIGGGSGRIGVHQNRCAVLVPRKYVTEA